MFNRIITSASNASCLLDPIPTWLVKTECAHELVPIIIKLINWSLTTGNVPEDWKVALVTPLLLKKLGNLPLVSIVAEKLVIPHLINQHCSENAPLPANQSSYRQHHSTETALLRVHDDILLNMDAQKVTLPVLLDLSAAFDIIDHGI